MADRREFLTAMTAALAVPRTRVGGRGPAMRAIPSAAQLKWQRDELALFTHFGMNTFTDREWGDGSEDPARFNPVALDVRQWARAAATAGARSMILTAKHHDGFCLWPTATTRHSVRSSPWRDGDGDVVREFVDACRAERLRPGLYLSPWDRNAPTYGDSARYNDMYVAQLTELLTRYGQIAEVWFDGANGEGPNGRKQLYDWKRVWATVRQLQPGAVIFSDAGPDVRWIGNENGVASETNWSAVDPKAVPFPGASGDAVMEMLKHGDPDGNAWRPGETDVSIRPGWFYHASDDAKVRTPDNLRALYFSSVGRNSKLLLNVPPTSAGILHESDVRALLGMRSLLNTTFAEDAANGAHRTWRTRASGGSVVIDFRRPARIATVELAEAIAHGQSIARFIVEAVDASGWRVVAHGTTVGYKRLLPIAPVDTSRLRVTVESLGRATQPRVAAWTGAD